jgi:hypothetical protein
MPERFQQRFLATYEEVGVKPRIWAKLRLGNWQGRGEGQMYCG